MAKPKYLCTEEELIAQRLKWREDEARYAREMLNYSMECARETWLTIEQVKTLQKRGYTIKEIRAGSAHKTKEWMLYVPRELVRVVPNISIFA